MADETEGPVDDDEPAGGRRRDGSARPTTPKISALAELALCENLSQTSGWAARWSATMAGADATLLWAPDTVHPIFLCIGAEGQGVEKLLRPFARRETRDTFTISCATGSPSSSRARSSPPTILSSGAVGGHRAVSPFLSRPRA